MSITPCASSSWLSGRTWESQQIWQLAPGHRPVQRRGCGSVRGESTPGKSQSQRKPDSESEGLLWAAWNSYHTYTTRQAREKGKIQRKWEKTEKGKSRRYKESNSGRKWDKVRVNVGKWVKRERIKNRETNRKQNEKGKKRKRE